MKADTRVKINIQTGEIELEGSEEFVNTQIENLSSLISTISIHNIPPLPISNGISAEPEKSKLVSSKTDLTVPDTFGEWIQFFNDDITDSEKALITAFYVQSQSDAKEFKTSEVNNSLKEHGIKLSNVSLSLKQLESKKHTFQTRKDGPKIKYMRVSQDGESHLKTLLR